VEESISLTVSKQIAGSEGIGLPIRAADA